MKFDLIVVGAGGFSRQIVEMVEQLDGNAGNWNLVGFLDDNSALHGTEIFGYPVLGPVERAGLYSTAKFVIGIANYRAPLVRRTVERRLAVGPDRYATLIHPTAQISRRSRIGYGTVLLQHVVIAHDVAIGNHVLISPACVVGHGAVLGNFATLAAQVGLSGSVVLEPGAYLGASSTVLQNVRVGEGALVGIGAVVLADVPAGETVLGNPAQKLRLGAGRKTSKDADCG